ncbi:MAG: hypothetical protein H6828_16075 [Planctomycetes bacterium]|nr:hypothetical protein [Planctomycetota bacterium]
MSLFKVAGIVTLLLAGTAVSVRDYVASLDPLVPPAASLAPAQAVSAAQGCDACPLTQEEETLEISAV